MQHTHVTHGFAPIFDAHSRVLVLGSLPSVLSRENAFYYGNPQNRFWRVTAAVFGCAVPQTIAEKTRMLLDNGVALWDVIASCDIAGSADASIRNVVPNDLSRILDACRIETIYANGKTAEKVYNRWQKPLYGRDIVPLPSTSPANAAWSADRLIEAWRVIGLSTAKPAGRS